MVTDFVALERYFGARVPSDARLAELVVGFGNEKAKVAVADPTDAMFVPPPPPPDGTTGPEPDDP
jgi:hypothetical protein